jgi:DNA-binding CsgD family transcriptional regulator
MPKRKDLEKPANNCPLNVNPSQSPSVPPVKNGRDSRRKLRGASLLSDHAWLEISRTLGLTKREVQIVQSVFDNLPETEIAKRFRISGHTVHTHLNRLFKKLTVTSRTELVLRIMEQMIGLTLSETGVLPPICRRHHTGGCCLHNSPGKPAKP